MTKPLLLDGPMGTEIDRRGGDTTVPLWSARSLIQNPILVERIHADFIIAGADIITTNTFRTQEYTLKKAGVHSVTAKQLTQEAVYLGKNAIEKSGRSIKLAGSIAPVEDCYSPQLVPKNNILAREHEKSAKWLYDAGVDLFLIETMNTIREATIAVDIVGNYDIPVYLSFTADNNGKILGASSIRDWTFIMQEFQSKTDLILVNCTSIEGTGKVIEIFQKYKFNNFGFYPNFGTIDPVSGWSAHDIPVEYTSKIKQWIELDPKLVGTCCGATPAETSNLRKYLDSKIY